MRGCYEAVASHSGRPSAAFLLRRSSADLGKHHRYANHRDARGPRGGLDGIGPCDRLPGVPRPVLHIIHVNDRIRDFHLMHERPHGHLIAPAR